MKKASEFWMLLQGMIRGIILADVSLSLQTHSARPLKHSHSTGNISLTWLQRRWRWGHHHHQPGHFFRKQENWRDESALYFVMRVLLNVSQGRVTLSLSRSYRCSEYCDNIVTMIGSSDAATLSTDDAHESKLRLLASVFLLEYTHYHYTSQQLLHFRFISMTLKW